MSLDEARAAAGISGSVAGARLAPGAYAAFVELHIEQGPELERTGMPIGVVTAIAAPATLRVELSGRRRPRRRGADGRCATTRSWRRPR